jgi:hypothetical protein
MRRIGNEQTRMKPLHSDLSLHILKEKAIKFRVLKGNKYGFYVACGLTCKFYFILRIFFQFPNTSEYIKFFCHFFCLSRFV